MLSRFVTLPSGRVVNASRTVYVRPRRAERGEPAGDFTVVTDDVPPGLAAPTYGGLTASDAAALVSSGLPFVPLADGWAVNVGHVLVADAGCVLLSGGVTLSGADDVAAVLAALAKVAHPWYALQPVRNVAREGPAKPGLAEAVGSAGPDAAPTPVSPAGG